MNRRAPILALVALVALAALTLWWVRSGGGRMHDFVGPTMGAGFTVRVAHELSEVERDRIQALIEERVGRIERLMSTYDTTSELSRLNRHESTAPFPVSAELLDVLTLAREVSERSGGAFDVTVAPLVEAWGFGAGGDLDGPLRPPPDDAELAVIGARVGYEHIEVDVEAGTVSKLVPGATIDVSGLATGYAAERVAADLRGLGLSNVLVDVGGELQASGAAPGGRDWRVGIERPDDMVGSVWGSMPLSEEGIATSGDYRDYYELDGARYAHIVDPRTRRPIPMRGTSVTVVHASAALADAWATALTVLGPVEGLEVARREGLAVLFLERTEEGVRSVLSPAMAARAEVPEEMR
jgi:thiamine biosynthesis lipoprotein